METAKSRDYVAIAKAYADEAIKDRKRTKHGRMMRAAAQRFIDDLKRAKKKGAPFFFDEWHARDACDFIEKLPHVEGKWETPDIVLHPSHVFFVVQLFGFRDAVTKGRRFTSALFAVARKNAKSTLSAAILLYCECCEDEEGAQIISAATTFSQASIIFNVAKRMVEKTPDLREAFGLQTWAKSISRMETGASFKPIHAKGSTQDGLNPSHVGLDEIHAHKTPDLINVLTSAAGARKSPLWLYTTTEGYTNAGPWGEMRQMAKNILLAGLPMDHFLVVFFAIDDEDKAADEKADDEFDESKWVKANPLMDVSPTLLAAIRKDAAEAKAMPSKHAEFNIKRVNRSSSTAHGWINLRKWRACGGVVDLDWLQQFPCYAGLDLSSVGDLTALRYVWEIENRYYTYGRRWVPEEAIRLRSERGMVPYAGWQAAGLMQVTPGEAVDYDVIGEQIREDRKRFDVRGYLYDPWNGKKLVSELESDGLPMIQCVQGPRTFHPIMTEFERVYTAGRLSHGGDPVLTWNASNIIARKDANNNMAPDKRKSPDKIDDMVALLMAFGGWVQTEESAAHESPLVDLNA